MPHTPGPWTFFKVGPVPIRDQLKRPWRTPTDVSPSIPTTKHFVGADGQGFALTVGLHEPTDTANARLIAAAPELYAALKLFEKAKSLNDEQLAMQAAKAALAHADGSEPR